MEPIEANYVPDGDDWAITVSRANKTLTGKAPGLIAARDRADQLVEKLAPGEEHPTVVHRLEGDAYEFTSAYLTARLTMPEPRKNQEKVTEKSSEKPASKARPRQSASVRAAASKSAPKSRRRKPAGSSEDKNDSDEVNLPPAAHA